MNTLKQFFNTDTRAVSPVIAVILMVAIVVILAAVVGTSMFGLADNLGEPAPQAVLDFEHNNDNTYTITHTAGTNLDANTVDVQYNNANGDKQTDNVPASFSNVGDSFTTGEVGTDQTIRIIWTSPDGSSSSIIRSYDVGLDGATAPETTTAA